MTYPLDVRALAHALREWRRENGWTLEDVTERTSISPATLSRLERARHEPRLETVISLCLAMGRRVEEFFTTAEAST